MIGRRPRRSLRRPHHGLTNTQSVAEVAKIVDTWNGVMPICRAAGGRMLNSIDWPMPMQTRQHEQQAQRARVLDPCEEIHRGDAETRRRAGSASRQSCSDPVR